MKNFPRIRKYLPLFIGLLILSQIETACGNSKDMHSYSGPAPESVAPAAAALDKQRDASGELASVPEGRKVIVSHAMTVEVGDLDASFKKAVALAEKSGGYTTGTNRYKDSDGSLHASVGMRVPPGRVSSVLSELRGLGEVVSESSSGEDITDQYVDLEARLGNAKASEKRLQEMMDRKTANLSDVLAVERELTRVRGDIESMEARRRSWDTLTQTVEINVELKEPPRAMPAGRKIWEPIKTAFGDAIEVFANSLHYAIVFVLGAIPWFVVFGVLVYAGAKLVKRRKKTME
ncbi:MAG: DUF4349 domain-containing protein [Nitrospirae bacterium]|nr:DUF4349 domain-containing protein [Nitrospirota bacterium]